MSVKLTVATSEPKLTDLSSVWITRENSERTQNTYGHSQLVLQSIIWYLFDWYCFTYFLSTSECLCYRTVSY